MTHLDPVPLFTLTADEVTKVCSLAGITNNHEALGEYVWLLIERNHRIWIIDTEVGRAVVRVEGTHQYELHGQWFAMSQRVVQFASSCTDDVELALVGDSITANTTDRSAVIDLMRPSGPPPSTRTHRNIAVATVDRELFARTLWSARCTPTGADVIGAPLPPMWLQVSEGTLALHVDWTDAVGGKATYRMAATIDGDATTVSINHQALSRFMTFFSGFADDDEDITVAIVDVTPENGTAGTTRRAVVIGTDDSDYVTWTIDALRERWETAVSTMLEEAGVVVRSHAGTEWTVRAESSDVRIVLHSGHPDVARVSTTVATHVDTTLDLLTEINTLNAAATGVRFWVEDGAVHAATDVRCSELDSLVPSVLEVARSASRYAPLVALLGAAV
jgi:hypothetical protein